jgi:hypothetical protein
MSFLEEVNSTKAEVEEAARLEAKRKAENQEAERIQDIADGKQYAEEQIPLIRKRILADVKNSKSSTYVSISSNSRNYGLDYFGRAYCDAISDYFKNEGLRVMEYDSEMEPTGSDPLFPYTVYSVYLMIYH